MSRQIRPISRTFSYKGKEYSFLLREPDLLEELKCSICLELADNPRQTTCGHLFCKGCVDKGASADFKFEECPICKSESPILFPDQRTTLQVRNFKVKCLNSKSGCNWKGDLGDCEKHQKEICQFEFLSCPWGCDERLQRSLLASHGVTCNSFPLPCPAGCRKIIQRSEMKSHLAICKEEKVSCEYFHIGCTVVKKRKKMNDHLQKMKDLHLKMASFVVQQLRHEVSSLKQMKQPNNAPPQYRPWLEIFTSCYLCPPCVMRVNRFKDIRKMKEEWVGKPFYSHYGGYKLCLKVMAQGYGMRGGSHVSVFVFLMDGRNDDDLKWPLKATIEISLLNQLHNFSHHIMRATCNAERVPQGQQGQVCLAFEKFIPLSELTLLDQRCSYLRKDCLFLQVASVELNIN